VTAISKQCAELAAKMISKKDFNETKSKVNALTSRGQEYNELNTKIIQMHSEFAQNVMEIRTDIQKRINDVSNQLTEQLIKRSSVDDIRQVQNEYRSEFL
jgi:flagellar biosynthesis/type III secretory pathway protein FliH